MKRLDLLGLHQKTALPTADNIFAQPHYRHYFQLSSCRRDRCLGHSNIRFGHLVSITIDLVARSNHLVANSAALWRLNLWHKREGPTIHPRQAEAGQTAHLELQGEAHPVPLPEFLEQGSWTCRRCTSPRERAGQNGDVREDTRGVELLGIVRSSRTSPRGTWSTASTSSSARRSTS